MRDEATTDRLMSGGSRSSIDRDDRCSWGLNNSGQLGLAHKLNIGDNEHPDSQAPVMLGGPAIATATGTWHSCALLATKQMRCWGVAGNGQLGLGNSVEIGATNHPADFPPVVFTEVEDLSAGAIHNCFLRPGGAVHCFGGNYDGQLGLGHTNEIGDSESPDVGPIGLGAPAIDVDAGGHHTCAVLQGGAVRCWGDNNRGQLGLGHTNDIGDDELPLTVPPVQLGGPAVRVSAGFQHTCALMATGQIRCWGYGDGGRLGYANENWIGDDEHPEVAGDVQVF
jgi:alpha-tubulin suppressor-like RCC1 family protein